MTEVEPGPGMMAPPSRVRWLGFWALLELVVGRSIFRVVLYGANLALLAAWGRSDFDRYAAASAGLGWILALAQSGPEKAALNLIPRSDQDRDALTGGLVWFIRLVPLALGTVAGAAVFLYGDATVTLYAVMAAESAAVGCNVAAVGTRRALGQNRADPRNFAMLSIGWIGITALAVVASLGPITYVVLQLLLTVAVTEVTLAGLQAPLRALTARSQPLRLLGTTAALMGVYDLVAYAASSVVFLLLPLTRYGDQSGDLYIALAGWSIAFGFFAYGLRVFQPQVSLRLAGPLGNAARATARTLGWWALVLNGAWLVSAAVVAWMSHLNSAPAGRAMVVVLLVLLASHTPVVVVNGFGLYLLENLDGRSLRLAASAAAAGMVVVVLASLVVVPLFGAVGAVWACAAGELGSAGVLVRRSREPSSARQVVSPVSA